MSSLENQLETAYAALAKANEPGLAAVTPRLSTLILAQAPAPDASEDDDEAAQSNEQVPVPYMLLTAKCGEESIPHTGIFETELTVEVGDNAQPGSDDGALDSLFTSAARPLFYKTLNVGAQSPPVILSLFQALSAAVPGFHCYGMPQRATGTAMEIEGSVVKRSISATFLCQTTA